MGHRILLPYPTARPKGRRAYGPAADLQGGREVGVTAAQRQGVGVASARQQGAGKAAGARYNASSISAGHRRKENMAGQRLMVHAPPQAR